MVTWNCTSCLSAAVVVLLSDDLRWDFLVQMCILDTVTRNPVALLSPYPSLPVPFSCLDFRTHGLNERMLVVCKMAWMTGEIGSHNESSEPSHQLVQQESAALLRSLLSRHNIQHCAFLTSPRQTGNAMERSRRGGMSPFRWERGGMSPFPWERGVSPRCLWYPQGCGERLERGLLTLLCLLCLRWRISSLSCQCSDCTWRRGRGCVASSEKISCLYFIFCSCSTFFFFPSPHHSPLPMWVVCLNHILQNQFSKQIRWAAETAMQSGKNVHSSLHFMQWPEQ